MSQLDLLIDQLGICVEQAAAAGDHLIAVHPVFADQLGPKFALESLNRLGNGGLRHLELLGNLGVVLKLNQGDKIL